MQHVDFMHLVRLSEQACESDARAYRRSVWWFAALGYAAVIAIGLAALASLLALGWAWRQRGFSGWMVWPGLAAAALLLACTRALLIRFEAPEGFRVEPADAPRLFDALERMRRRVKGPPIDVVLIVPEFNAAAVHQPRWGLWGHTNYLLIGWPMLCSLEPRRLLTVIAHEYGHLRGEHGKFSAWVYRTRSAWARIQERYQHDDSPLSWLFSRFFAWYFPRFYARTFAMARQDEYEADRIAAELCSAEVVGQAYNEIQVKARWYDEEYWLAVWRRAALQDKPEPLPHAEMQAALLQPPPPAFAQEALRLALQRLPTYDDTHPVPRDRLAALGQKPQLPDWSQHNAVSWLGAAAARAARHFDTLWWQEMRRDWARHHEHLRRCKQRIDTLKARTAQLDADGWLEWAECFEALSGADSSAFYERALRCEPSHPEAMRGLAARRAQGADPGALDLLERLQAEHVQHGYAACSMALELLDRVQHAGHDVTAKTRRAWRERLERFETLEAQAWQAFSSAHPCEHAVAPRLKDSERKLLTEALIRTREVEAGWVCGKQVGVMPGRAYLVLFVRLKRLDEARANAVVRRLMQLPAFAGLLQVTVVDLHVRERQMIEAGAQPLYQRAAR
ncbi:M48 family metallopeptidase [Caldimonas brevitalea]|uniref:Peptidase M48 domain-containing protein n=1 Tax=Caldimonas brevitalea TaxID=413882 RepID=A0A0G3BY70_9BURK|nr:M48 family metallopeptidase [Caldimonas brevitalea]AKJ31490.1 hypothetical protein AAW51_4799 [Caldimonas brevitalea]